MLSTFRSLAALAMLGATSGCALITTPVKVAGAATSTGIKTTGAVVTAPVKMAGDSKE